MTVNTLIPEVLGGLVGFLECVACREDLAVCGLDDMTDKVFSDEPTGKLVDRGGDSHQGGQFHNPVTGYFVDE